MKYWVYKESRILGPFDKEGVSGFPGIDSGTLVCAGDPAGGSWIPAGELTDLGGIASGGAGGLLDDLPSSTSLLDQLQIDSSGLIGDDDFPDSFVDVLSAHSASDDAQARISREKISDLTAKLESMYLHITKLEAAQADLVHRLAAKDNEIRALAQSAGARPSAQPPAPAVAAEAFPPPAPVEGALDSPSFGKSSFAISAEPGLDLELPPNAMLSEPPTGLGGAAKSSSFSKPKSFKIASALKSFKVVGADDTVPAASGNPVPQFTIEPIAEAQPPAVEPPAVQVAGPAVPAAFAPVTPPVPFVPAPAPVMLAPAPFPEQLPVMALFPTPADTPPNTLSRAQPIPDLAPVPSGGADDATVQAPPPATLARSIEPGKTAEDVPAAARFAKPEPAPSTGEIKKPRQNNKVFLIAGVVLVTLLMIVGVIFMRQPKDDLKQMATLDDGKAPIGLTTDDGSASPRPMVKPKIAEAPQTAPPAGPSAEHAAAIELVKDFPLDGERGTVGRWLQYSYTASPGAGTEEWNASTTGENSVLVEYRLVPGASGGKGALYLFEVDSNGIVMGKNVDARQMLAGGPPVPAAKVKKKPVKKSGSKRRRVPSTPKEVPLLPLPDSGELRPPAEDDGTFGTDTINSGI